MAEGSEFWFDSETGATVINESNVSTDDAMSALVQQHPEAISLARWTQGLKHPGRNGTIFERDRYVTPPQIFNQFRTATDAAENDDVVSGVVESTEALAFNKMSMYCDDEDETDVWNQIMADLDMDSRLREMWREGFTISQFYCAMLWDYKTYKVTGSNRRKVFPNLRVPVGITLLDPLKVVPVGNFMFGQERLAYVADRDESLQFYETLAGSNTSDLIVSSLLEAPYAPTDNERKFLWQQTGANMDYLFLLKKDAVWRHTETRPGYERFATCRMKSIFELLDLKNQLRQMDRTFLLGGINFLVLVKKGSPERPATQTELNQLAGQVKGTSRLPIIVGDDRIEIEIITPKLDQTLKPERYNTIDARITSRLYQILMCVDEETEAFTMDGWKGQKDIGVDDVILTLNPETGLSEWLPVEGVKRYDVDIPLWSMETKSHSSLTTFNHRWFVRQQSTPELTRMQWYESRDLNTASTIPLSAPHSQAPLERTYSDSIVELIAWYITEGHDFDESAGVEIAQCGVVNPKNVISISEALVEEFGASGYAPDGLWHRTPDNLKFYLRAAAGRVLRSIAPGKVPPPGFILALTASQLELFIYTCIKGNGHYEVSSGRYTFYQDRATHNGILEAFEYACILAGKSYTRIRHNEKMDKITLLKNKFVAPIASSRMGNFASVGEKQYKGVVWCPQTQNATFFARRRGTTYWTGNSGNYSSGTSGDDSIKLARVIARGMESRRHMIRRAIERNIIQVTLDANPQLKTVPTMNFHPKRIALDFDPNFATYLLDLRDRGDISRDAVLSEVDFDEAEEAMKREYEDSHFDTVFQPTNVPYNAPAPDSGQPASDGKPVIPGNSKTAGRTGGGRTGGGGMNKQSGTSNPGRGPNKPESK